MKEGWKNARLGDLLEIKYGKDHKYLKEGAYPVYGSGGIMRFADSFLYSDESILIPRKGTLTNLFFMNTPFWTVDTMFWSIINKEKVYPKFLYYLLKTHDLSTLDVGAAIPSLTTKTLNEVLVQIPTSKETQRKIATILSGYDDLIENNLKRIKLLEEKAQQTYEEWFVRLKFPGHETAVIDEESGLPEGWRRGKLSELLELQRGFDLPKSERVSEYIPIYASTGIVDFHNEAKVQGPGIITGRSGTIGQVMYSATDFWPLNTSLWVKKFKLAKPLFAYHFLKKISLERFAGGSAVPSLDRKVVHAQRVVLPDKRVVEMFEKYAIPIFDATDKLASQNRLLKEARDIILPRLMTGAVGV